MFPQPQATGPINTRISPRNGPRDYRGAVIEEWSRRAGCIELDSWEG
jgi:hypothetical protein